MFPEKHKRMADDEEVFSNRQKVETF